MSSVEKREAVALPRLEQARIEDKRFYRDETRDMRLACGGEVAAAALYSADPLYEESKP